MRLFQRQLSLRFEVVSRDGAKEAKAGMASFRKNAIASVAAVYDRRTFDHLRAAIHRFVR
jgi:hypothetical protein